MKPLFSCCLVLLVCTTTLSAAEPLRITDDGSFKQNLQFSPDGKKVLFSRIHRGTMALWTMTPDGKEIARLLPGHREPHFDGHWSSDGRKIVYVYDKLEGTDGKLRINICNADGSDDRTFIPHVAFERSPRWSPDGKRVLWVSNRDKNPELYTVNDEGKDPIRLTNESASDLHPNWSPDGKFIVFSSGRTGRQKIHRMNADGSDVKKLTAGEGLDAWPVWSPDGKTIAYESRTSGHSNIWRMNADGTNPVNLTPHASENTSPAWSPDGTKILFVSDRDGGSDVYQITVPK